MENKNKNTPKVIVKDGIVSNREQSINPVTGLYVKRDTPSGKIISVKKDGTCFEVVTITEIKKMAPTLKKLADYDKKTKIKR
jgi:hypothetical protein